MYSCENCGALFTKKIEKCLVCRGKNIKMIIIKNLVLFCVCGVLTLAFIYHEELYQYGPLNIFLLFALFRIAIWCGK
ncbi:MAG: hypothetical protein AB1779_06730 [Candidatus Thermoplasmatota archaeon]